MYIQREFDIVLLSFLIYLSFRRFWSFGVFSLPCMVLRLPHRGDGHNFWHGVWCGLGIGKASQVSHFYCLSLVGHDKEIKSMSSQIQGTTTSAAKIERLSIFQRYLTLWVFLCILVGIALGRLFPGVVVALDAMSISQVSIPIAI
jgi:hypothetical protein